MSTNELANFEDKLLKDGIANSQKLISKAQKSIDIQKAIIQYYQSELDRRALAAYWLAHPELTPVQVGDKFIVTQVYLDWYAARYQGDHTSTPLGELRTITSIGADHRGIMYGRSDVTWTIGAPIEIICQMCRAYLESEKVT